MTLNNKIVLLPSEQSSWLLLIKEILKREFNKESKREIINAVVYKAKERGYIENGSLLNSDDLEKYLKN